MQDTVTTARALYGDGWHDLPRFVQEAAADFVADLLDLDARQVLNGDGFDRIHECADAAVPAYDYQRYELLTDPRTVRAIEHGLDEFGADAVKDTEGRISLSQLVGVGIYGAISNAFGHMLFVLGASFEAFGLDADAAEVASALLPEWSGTVRELVEAAPRLAAEGVTR
jgi:hypothetical protein